MITKNIFELHNKAVLPMINIDLWLIMEIFLFAVNAEMKFAFFLLFLLYKGVDFGNVTIAFTTQ